MPMLALLDLQKIVENTLFSSFSCIAKCKRQCDIYEGTKFLKYMQEGLLYAELWIWNRKIQYQNCLPYCHIQRQKLLPTHCTEIRKKSVSDFSRAHVISCETARVFEACLAAFVSKLTLGTVPSSVLENVLGQPFLPNTKSIYRHFFQKTLFTIVFPQ